jgi:hypothetical protein
MNTKFLFAFIQMHGVGLVTKSRVCSEISCVGPDVNAGNMLRKCRHV